jgi:hypothetical protein
MASRPGSRFAIHSAVASTRLGIDGATCGHPEVFIGVQCFRTWLGLARAARPKMLESPDGYVTRFELCAVPLRCIFVGTWRRGILRFPDSGCTFGVSSMIFLSRLITRSIG